MNYYNLLSKLCEAKGVSLAQMCRDLGKPYSFVTELKMGRRKTISKKNLEVLCQYFGVPISTFFESSDNPIEQVQDEMLVEQKLLFDISKNATPEQMRQIIEIAKVITKS